MATDPFQLYPVISQIAAAFAGFGSLASSLGARRAGDDARMDAYRLEHMLEASLSATLFGLLPATLAAVFEVEAWALRIAALVAAAAILAYAPLAAVRARRIRHVAGFSRRATIVNSVCVWAGFLAFALCGLGIPAGRGAGLYLFGLMGLLGSTMMLFSRVIISMLRPHKEPSPDQSL